MAAGRPRVIYWAPRLAAKVWNIETIYISENGTSSEDKLAADGKVYDLDRIMYLRNYLAQLQRAIAEGVPVQRLFPVEPDGQFRMDLWIWQRFGVYRVDFETQAGCQSSARHFFATWWRGMRSGPDGGAWIGNDKSGQQASYPQSHRRRCRADARNRACCLRQICATHRT